METESNSKSSILVVEDSPNERAGLSMLLERAGFSVTAAADGIEGLAQLEQKKFDLLLVDAGLPRMGGIEMLSRLPAQPRPKVLVITGDGTAETALGALREHAEQFLEKPVDPKQLVESIRETLDAPPVAGKIRVLSADPHFVELRIPCERAVADRLQEFMKRLESGLPQKERASVELAFHELLLNAIEWGGRMDPACEVLITFLRTPRLLLYRIADPGAGFDASKLDHAAAGHADEDPCAHIEAREAKGMRPGGYGIVLAESMVDELVYNEAHNEVVLLKYLEGKKAA